MIYYNSLIPPRGFAAINLFGLIFARKESRPLSATALNHEAIHTAQQREMLFVAFYVWYVVEWLIKLLRYRNRDKAYYAISFEREAYANQKDFEYLKSRTRYEWLKWM